MKPYLPDLSVTVKRNALRLAEVWLDEYKSNVNVAWNLPFKVRHRLYWGTIMSGAITPVDRGGKKKNVPLPSTRIMATTSGTYQRGRS